jgi:ferredoxin--NADP+ reductase/benzoate/toluate 1,2-dioxygenase reductase subunit
MVSYDNKIPHPVSAGDFSVISKRLLTDSTFVLRFTRNNLQFKAGQHLIVGLKGEMDQREYSVYSGEKDEYLEILVKEVKDGNISIKLKDCSPGDLLQVNGPFGSFGIQPYDIKSGKFVFIATGTGISPFHSMVRTNPAIDYTLIHGVRFANEAYESDSFDSNRFILCTSKEKNADHAGRVTSFLQKYKVPANAIFLLCGNGGMIYEVYHILRDKGIQPQNIISERYF